jgi:hypothetical protein
MFTSDMKAGTALLALVFLPIASIALAAPRRHVVWRGTLTTTEGLTGAFSARAHFREGPPDGSSEYLGHFRCRGSGCPLHHGRADFSFGLAVDRINVMAFRHGPLTCMYVTDSALPGLAIDGTYGCSPYFAVQGTIHLVASARAS